jgi:hypothetical protein
MKDELAEITFYVLYRVSSLVIIVDCLIRPVATRSSRILLKSIIRAWFLFTQRHDFDYRYYLNWINHYCIGKCKILFSYGKRAMRLRFEQYQDCSQINEFLLQLNCDPLSEKLNAFRNPGKNFCIE